MHNRRRRENYQLLIKRGVFPWDVQSFVSQKLVGFAGLINHMKAFVVARRSTVMAILVINTGADLGGGGG